MDIGVKIRNLRLKMGLTQDELAQRADLTKGFISQLERDHSSPSVDTLDAILRGLGTSLTEFFRETGQEAVIYPADQAVVKADDKLGHRMRFLVSNAQELDMEAVLVEIRPGGRSKTYTPFEGQVFGFVLDGCLELHLDEVVFRLDREDSFYFGADRSFYLDNPGTTDGRLLWVLSPPNF